MGDFIEGFAEEVSGKHPRLHNFLAIFCVVTAVDIAARKINQNVRVVHFVDPTAEPYAIPLDSSPGHGDRATSQDHDGVSFGVKMPGKHGSYLTVPARYNYSHG